jgi:Ca2+-binding EF-hand superfamily protein
LKQEIEREFKSADANGDGYLGLEEARARFPAVAQNFKRIDRDDDGRVSLAEFMAAKRAMLERRLNKPGS